MPILLFYKFLYFIISIDIDFFNRFFLAKTFGDVSIASAIFVASLQLLITSVSSVQMTLFKRNLDFKPIFYSQTLSALVPLLITVPLAFFGFGYWSVIIGNLIGTILKAILLSFYRNII